MMMCHMRFIAKGSLKNRGQATIFPVSFQLSDILLWLSSEAGPKSLKAARACARLKKSRASNTRRRCGCSRSLFDDISRERGCALRIPVSGVHGHKSFRVVIPSAVARTLNPRRRRNSRQKDGRLAHLALKERRIMQKFLSFIAMAFIGAGLTACGSHNGRIESGTCDRQCLEGYVDQYLDAMVAHDASMAPFAENVKYTENAEVISPASPEEGLWKTATGLRGYKFYVADPQAGQVAFVGLVQALVEEPKEGETVEVEKSVLLSMRLKVENERITEVESIVVQGMMGRGLEGGAMSVPPAAYSEALPEKERVSRERLVEISNLYFDSIEQCDAGIVPWHEECYRLENGAWTAGEELPEELAAHMPEPPAAKKPARGGEPPVFGREACPVAIDSGIFALIESIRPRRIPVVDVERGVTWGVYMFNHPGVETVTMPDGTTQPAAYFAGQPNSMPMSELFKIKNGKIRDIMAIGVVKEYMSGSGWE
jgi:hypothetical protein